MKTITLKNNFHNTTARIRVSGETRYGTVEVSASQWARVERKTCGMSDCCCKGVDMIEIDGEDRYDLDITPGYNGEYGIGPKWNSDRDVFDTGE